MLKDSSKEGQKRWWLLVIAMSGTFVITSLAYVAAGFGDGEAPVNRFLNQHGGTLIVVLAGLTIGSGVLAMYLDQREQSSAESDVGDDS